MTDREDNYFKTAQTGKKSKLEQHVVFSAQASYNPTAHAVKQSLQEVFDEFHVMVTGELKQNPMEYYE